MVIHSYSDNQGDDSKLRVNLYNLTLLIVVSSEKKLVEPIIFYFIRRHLIIGDSYGAIIFTSA